MLVFPLLLLAAALGVSDAQLSNRNAIGPTTTFATKAGIRVCDIRDHGAVSGSTADVGPAIAAAWSACSAGGLIYVPPGTYSMSTWQSLKNCNNCAFQLDGTIVRKSDAGGNMLSFTNCNNFEFFSGNSKGAFQGYGYKLIQNGVFGPRFLRFTNVNNFSVHGFALVDSASYYVVFDTCTNGEIYNMILRGIQIGETDGIDFWGSNTWIHDIEVTNGDECVTVKSPANHVLIESIYCNISGGTAIGSLGTATDISYVYYRNIYAWQADACYIKTNGGDGTVHDITWDTVITRSGPYPLTLNEAWGSDRGSTGVQLYNLYFKNWHGQNSANSRPIPRLECDPTVPCYNITLNNVNLWTSSGSNVHASCQNAFGSGSCLRPGVSKAAVSTYSTVTTIAAAPSYATASMPSDLPSAFPSTRSFTIPAVPTSFYPGLSPSSRLLSLSGPGGRNVKRAVAEATPAPSGASFKA